MQHLIFHGKEIPSLNTYINQNDKNSHRKKNGARRQDKLQLTSNRPACSTQLTW